MPNDSKSPWSQGYDAGCAVILQGYDNAANPFPPGTPDHALWAMGKADALEDDEDWPDDA